MQCTKGPDGASQNDSDLQQQPPQGGTGTGEGAASAFARMKLQHDRRVRQKPADDPGTGGHHDAKP